MANMRLADTQRNAQAQAIADAINAGDGPGTLKFYTGAQPADADMAVSMQTPLGTQTLLGTLIFSDPCELPIANGLLTFSTITEDSAAHETGTATWARIEDSDGNTVFDCDVMAMGGGGAIEINTVNIVQGGPIRILSFVITIPAG